MARGTLSLDEINILSKNPYVISVDTSRIVYSNAFKLLFIEKYNLGFKPSQIFADAGFDISILGTKRIERASARWRESFAAGTLGVYPDHTIRHKKALETKSAIEKKDAVIASVKAASVKKINSLKASSRKKLSDKDDLLRQQKLINSEKLAAASKSYSNRLAKSKNKSSRDILELEAKFKKVLDAKQREIDLLNAKVDILKKAGKLGRRRCVRKVFGRTDLCRLVEDSLCSIKSLSVSALCSCLGLSRSTYYYYVKAKQARALKEEKDSDSFFFIYDAFKHIRSRRKGSRSIQDVLEADYGLCFSRKKIQRLMRKFGLRCPAHSTNPYKGMRKASAEDRTCPNILKRHFHPGQARRVLLTDITYIKHRDRFSYLSVIIDSQTNEPLAYKLSRNLKVDFVIDTLKQLDPDQLDARTIIHSDQGVHYTSKVFRELVSDLGISQSMSRRGNCLDNAPMESFFGQMKTYMNFDKDFTFNELEKEIDNYMQDYRYTRIQRRLNKMTPYQYYRHLLQAA